MKEYNDIYDLEYKKNKIKIKEDIISKSQIRQHKLEIKIKKLKKLKENIVNKKTSILGKIFSYLIYDIVMITLLILLIGFSLDKLILTNSVKLIIYIIEIYIGVTIISISGAIVSSKIEVFFKEYLYKMRLNKITELIKRKEEDLQFEIDLQEQTKHDITNIINIYEEAQEYEKNSNIVYQNSTYINNQVINNHKKKIRKL